MISVKAHMKFSISPTLWRWAATVLVISALAAPALRGAESPPVVGLVGHSLVNHKMPRMLRVLSEDQKTGFTVYEQIINGSPLSHQWKNHDQCEKYEDVYGDLYAAIEKGTPKFNHVILTERVAIAECIEWEDTLGYVIKWRNHALATEPTAQVYFLSTWVGFKNGEWWKDIPDDATWRKRTLEDGALFEKIAVEASLDPRSTAGKPIRVIPGHKAMVRLYDKLAAGELPWLGKDIHAVFSDDIHLTDVGNYYLACLVHSVVAGKPLENATGVTKDQWGRDLTALTSVQASQLQGIAWEVARDAANP